jgi:glycosyltransferase involved in cell wall biosynthesis
VICLSIKSSGPDVTIIVPCYNEGASISEVLRRLSRIDWPPEGIETIVVDDGSTDNTADEAAGFPFVKLIRHKKNQGKGAAIRTGLKASTGKVIVIQDADLEYAPEYIPQLVKPILAGKADVVFGSRFRGNYQGMSLSHVVGNRMLSRVASLLCDAQITDIMTGHKAFRREVFNSFDLIENGFAVEVEMTVKSLRDGWRFTEVPIDYSYRSFGVSKIGFSDGLRSLLTLITDRYGGNGVSINHSRDRNEGGRKSGISL